jgi:hypothetical protein
VDGESSTGSTEALVSSYTITNLWYCMYDFCEILYIFHYIT